MPAADRDGNEHDNFSLEQCVVNERLSWLSVQASNIANMNTDGYRATAAVIESGSTDSLRSELPAPILPVPDGTGAPGRALPRALQRDIVNKFVQMKVAEHGYRANAAGIRSQDSMVGFILDSIAGALLGRP